MKKLFLMSLLLVAITVRAEDSCSKAIIALTMDVLKNTDSNNDFQTLKDTIVTECRGNNTICTKKEINSYTDKLISYIKGLNKEESEYKTSIDDYAVAKGTGKYFEAYLYRYNNPQEVLAASDRYVAAATNAMEAHKKCYNTCLNLVKLEQERIYLCK